MPNVFDQRLPRPFVRLAPQIPQQVSDDLAGASLPDQPILNPSISERFVGFQAGEGRDVDYIQLLRAWRDDGAEGGRIRRVNWTGIDEFLAGIQELDG